MLKKNGKAVSKAKGEENGWNKKLKCWYVGVAQLLPLPSVSFSYVRQSQPDKLIIKGDKNIPLFR